MIENIHFDIENEYNEIVGLKYSAVTKKLLDLAYDTENESDALKSSMVKWAVICNHRPRFGYHDLLHLMISSETCGLCMFFDDCSDCCEYTGMKFDDYVMCFETFRDAYDHKITGEKNNTVYYALEKVYNERHGSE